MYSCINKHINNYPLIFKLKAINYYQTNTINDTIHYFGMSKSSLFYWINLYIPIPKFIWTNLRFYFYVKIKC